MLTKEIVSALCSNYGLGTITQIDLARRGIENLNYFIDINNNSTLNSYVLTVIKTPSYSGDSYFEMMELLKQLEVAVPSPLKDLKGNVFNYIDNGEKALVQPRLPGNHISSVEIHHIRHLSKSIADLHQIPYQSKKLEHDLTPDQKELLRTSLKKAKTLTDTLENANVSKSLIHADLFKDNVLFDNEHISGLLDFHHASIGYCMYDLAVVAIDWCRTKDGGLNSEFLYELLKIYNLKKQITSDELWLFKDFIVFAALNFWLSRLLGQMENRERSKNPDEIKAILELLI